MTYTVGRVESKSSEKKYIGLRSNILMCYFNCEVFIPHMEKYDNCPSCSRHSSVSAFPLLVAKKKEATQMAI